MFKENPLAGWWQSCLYQSNRALGHKYAKHNEKITAQWLGCKLVWVVYCLRNAFPPPFSSSAIPHTEENPQRQIPFHVPFPLLPRACPTVDLTMWIWRSTPTREGQGGREAIKEIGFLVQDWPVCWGPQLVVYNFGLTQRGLVLD